MEELFEIKTRYGLFPDYRISKSGIVYSIKWNKIKPLSANSCDACGYPMVYLIGNNGKKCTIRIHLLVADTFIPNPNNYPCINHKNEIKTDNRVENLEWCTKAYNNTYNNKAVKIGLKLRDSNPRKRKVARMNGKGDILEIYKSVREAARWCGSENYDSNIHSGIRTKQLRYGYYWKFVDESDNPTNKDNQQPSHDLNGHERFRDYKLKLFGFKPVEYNTCTSAQHLYTDEDEDIVRTL